MLAELPPALAVAEAAGKLKGSSSHWINETFPDHSTFAWQRGYGAFSVSKSHIARVVAYIAGQKEHHHKRSFLDEFQELLKRHDVACSGLSPAEAGSR